MLYDQRRDAKTKADPFSLESLIAWLETKQAAEIYDYDDCKGKCLYGQFAAHLGIPWIDAGLLDRNHQDFRRMIYVRVAYQAPQTFGAALTRARAVLTERAGA